MLLPSCPPSTPLYILEKKGSAGSLELLFLNAATPTLLRCFANLFLFILNFSSGSDENRQLLFFQAIFTEIMSYRLHLDFSFRRKYCLSLYLHVDKVSLYLDYLFFL